jgi:hypothetical protein
MSEFKPKVWMACPMCGKQSPMPDPDVREWVGLTPEQAKEISLANRPYVIDMVRALEAKLKELNT